MPELRGTPEEEDAPEEGPSQRERTAVNVLLGEEYSTEGMAFTWGTTLAVRSCSEVLDVVEVRVDEDDLVGHVVFNPDGSMLSAFTPPEKH